MSIAARSMDSFGKTGAWALVFGVRRDAFEHLTACPGCHGGPLSWHEPPTTSLVLQATVSGLPARARTVFFCAPAAVGSIQFLAALLISAQPGLQPHGDNPAKHGGSMETRFVHFAGIHLASALGLVRAGKSASAVQPGDRKSAIIIPRPRFR
jgi:hypothetical protein